MFTYLSGLRFRHLKMLSLKIINDFYLFFIYSRTNEGPLPRLVKSNIALTAKKYQPFNFMQKLLVVF